MTVGEKKATKGKRQKVLGNSGKEREKGKGKCKKEVGKNFCGL
jgi:hypothetical protein